MKAKFVSSAFMKRALEVSSIGRICNRKGNSMLPVLGIFLVIGAFLQSSELTRIAQNNSITANARIRDSRQSISQYLARYTALPTAFRNSLVESGNADLQNCLFGNGGTPCAADGREYPLKLYAPAINGAPARLMSGAGAAGTSNAEPVFYNTKGQLCDAPTNTATVACPFEVTSTFRARCAGGAASCATAESIAVQYSIRTPPNLYTEHGEKNRLLLGAVINTASEVKVADILPPSFDYIPNAITKVSYVVNTTETPGTSTTTTTSVAGLTYDQAYQAILAAVGGNATLATTIANNLYTYYKITSLDTILGLTTVWLQNPDIAKRLADAISYRIIYWGNYTPPTAAQIAQMAIVPLSLTNPMLAKAIASGLVVDPVQAQAIANAIAGITNYDVAQELVAGRVTSTAVAQAFAQAMATTGLTGPSAYVVAQGVGSKNISDAALITQYASVIVASGANESVAQQIVQQGITDVNVAKQMVAASSTSTSTSTKTASTTATTTTTSIIVPVSYTAACTSSLDCGTTIGM